MYQLVRGNLVALLIALAVGITFYAVGKIPSVQSNDALNWISAQGGQATHAALVIGGIILSIIFFDQRINKSITRRVIEGFAFAAALFTAGFLLRPAYQISKIWATPTWALYSAAICTVIFILLYWLIDLKKVSGWTTFFKPAATNPLLTYIIPFILFALFRLLGISWPDIFYQGVFGIIWSIVFAVLVMTAVIGLNKLKIKLQL